MKVSNLLNEYFQNSYLNPVNRIVEYLPRNVPIEVKKSKWKRNDNGFLSRTFLFDEQEDFDFFISSLMKTISQLSLSKKISFFVHDNEVTIFLEAQYNTSTTELLDDVLARLEKT